MFINFLNFPCQPLIFPQPPNIPFMLTIGVLTHGKYGRRLLDTLDAHTIQGHLSRHTPKPTYPTSPHRRACNYQSKHTIPIQYPSNLTTFHIRTNLNTLRSLRPLRCMILVTAKSAKSAKIV